MNAFPNYRNINMASLAAASAYAQGSPATRFEKITNGGMETRVETWTKPLSALENFKQHVLKNKKVYLAAVLLLLCLFIVIGLVNNKKPAKDIADTEQPQTHDNGGGDILPPGVTRQPTPVVDQREPAPDPEKEKEPQKKEPEKPKEKKEEVKSSGGQGLKPAEEEKEEEKPAAKKDVLIMSKVSIQLYLQNDLSNSPERQDIPVTFSLKRDVEYQGVTIIKQGAIARGVIKLGKVQTDIDINSITAANGQQLSLKAERGHGRRNEISSNRNYTAIILPGVRLKF
jgi:hypothetical protein